MAIDYKKLSEKLYKILEYRNGRPEDICEELFIEYGRRYNNIILYHGSFGNTKEQVLKSYSGFISCTYDLDVAESFARSEFDNEELCTIIEIRSDNLYCLDVQKLIEECYNNLPDDNLCKYMFEVFNSENEMLIQYEDIKNNITFLDII